MRPDPLPHRQQHDSARATAPSSTCADQGSLAGERAGAIGCCRGRGESQGGWTQVRWRGCDDVASCRIDRVAETECMTRSDLVRRLAAANPHLYPNDLERIVDTVLEQIGLALVLGDRVELRGFGTFSTGGRNTRVARNPRTGQEVVCRARRFRISEPTKSCSSVSIEATSLLQIQAQSLPEISQLRRMCPSSPCKQFFQPTVDQHAAAGRDFHRLFTLGWLI